MRRIGILKNTAADEPEAQARLTAFMQGLQEVGWAVGCNLRVEYRWRPVPGDLARACGPPGAQFGFKQWPS
jgi:putative ABC transport system substrate-binding protein